MAGQLPAGPMDPPGLRDQVLQLFGEWCMLVEEQPAERAHRDFVSRLQQAGFLKVQLGLHGHAPISIPAPCWRVMGSAVPGP